MRAASIVAAVAVLIAGCRSTPDVRPGTVHGPEPYRSQVEHWIRHNEVVLGMPFLGEVTVVPMDAAGFVARFPANWLAATTGKERQVSYYKIPVAASTYRHETWLNIKRSHGDMVDDHFPNIPW